MAVRRRELRDENGRPVHGTVVNVQETTERWNEVRLVDGTTFRIKVVVDEVVRLDGRRDPEGNPIYTVLTHNVVNDMHSVDTVRHIGDQ